MRVNIIKESIITFPEKCVVCGEECLNEKIEITGVNAYDGWLLERWRGYLSAKPKMNVPCHNSCNENIKPKEALRSKIITGIALFSGGIYYLLRNSIDFWFWISALVSVATANLFFNKFWYAEPFFFLKNQYKYEFVFGNKQVAEEFKELNKDNLFDIGKLFDLKLNR